MSAAEANAERIVGHLLAAGVEIAASLPDSWLTAVIERIDREPRITHVRVAREDDGIGVCAGASLGGRRAALVCQNAGLLLGANALAGYGLHHQLPFVAVCAYRGSFDDRFPYQMYKGTVTEGVLAAIGVPYHVVDRVEGATVIEDAVRQAQLLRRPVAVLLREAALTGGRA